MIFDHYSIVAIFCLINIHPYIIIITDVSRERGVPANSRQKKERKTFEIPSNVNGWTSLSNQQWMHVHKCVHIGIN